MTDYSAATGTWQIDASHTTLGFAARHAMVAKVRGRFADFDGSFTIDGASRRTRRPASLSRRPAWTLATKTVTAT